jgi:hypothetical protein
VLRNAFAYFAAHVVFGFSQFARDVDVAVRCQTLETALRIWWGGRATGGALRPTLLQCRGPHRRDAAKILAAFDRDDDCRANGRGRQFAGTEVAFAVSFEPNFNQLAGISVQ